ncbi:hypothetical protein ASZ90_016911 [hydrocarbon metagenome]|uniref:Uncharacterized protein n=1 Tax=hydrocarbon metagenome TaxID=938273 RepID=A0A0W8EAK2_9ZZZZ
MSQGGALCQREEGLSTDLTMYASQLRGDALAIVMDGSST